MSDEQNNLQDEQELPDGWVWTDIATIADTSSGGTPSRKNPEYFVGNIPWVKSGELGDGLVEDIEEYISEEALNNSSAKLLPKGTLLIALYGATVGKLGILDIDAATNQAVCAISPLGNVDSRYLFHLLFSRRSELLSAAKGGAQLNISQQIVRQVRVPFPPINEQKRIIEKLESLLTTIDDAVAGLEQAKEDLKMYRQMILKAAVEGELTLEWREEKAGEIEDAQVLLGRILQERRERWEAEQDAKGRKNAKYEEPKAPDVDNLPDLPEGWIWACVDQIAELITKGSSPNWQGFDYQDKGIVFVRSQNVNWGFLDLTDVAYLPQEFNEKETKSILKSEDVLLNIVGASIGRAALATSDVEGGNINQAVAVIRLIEKGYLPALLVKNLISPDTQLRIHSVKVDVARANISLEDIRNLPIAFPSLEEQYLIIQTLESRLAAADELESSIDAQLKQGAELRQAVLQQAFEGKLVPQDPNDEPASVLLERIREEKERMAKEAKEKRQKTTRKAAIPKEPVSLVEVLKESKEPLTPEELFRVSGYDFSTVETFYTELKAAVGQNLILEERKTPSSRDTLLRASA